MFRRVGKLGRLFVCAKSSMQPSCTHSLAPTVLRVICCKELHRHRGLRDGPCLQEAACVCGGPGGSVQNGKSWRYAREGLPRSGELRETSQGGTQVGLDSSFLDGNITFGII